MLDVEREETQKPIDLLVHEFADACFLFGREECVGHAVTLASAGAITGMHGLIQCLYMATRSESQKARRNREKVIALAADAVIKAVRALAIAPDDARVQFVVRQALNEYDLLWRDQTATDAVVKAMRSGGYSAVQTQGAQNITKEVGAFLDAVSASGVTKGIDLSGVTPLVRKRINNDDLPREKS
jgi:stage V sporulation protein SpoVS